jgi:hypothetical protein
MPPKASTKLKNPPNTNKEMAQNWNHKVIKKIWYIWKFNHVLWKYCGGCSNKEDTSNLLDLEGFPGSFLHPPIPKT